MARPKKKNSKTTKPTTQENDTVTETAPETTTTETQETTTVNTNSDPANQPTGSTEAPAYEAALAEIQSIHMPDLRDQYPETLPSTPEIPFVQRLVWVSIDLVAQQFKLDGSSMNNRIRPEVEANADDLEPKIRMKGLLNPMLLNVEKPYSIENPERLRGDGRATVLLRIRRDSPELFEKLFPGDLVPCYVIACDREEATRISADHSDQRGLGHPFEIVKTCWQLLDAGHSIAKVIILQKAPLAKFSTRISGGKSKNWNDAKADRKRAKRAETPEERQEFIDLAVKAEFDALHGNVQDRNRERQTPLVREILVFHNEGIRPASGPLASPTQHMPKLTMGQIRKLLAAHQADQAAKPGVTRANPGPGFLKLFAEIVKASQEKKKGVRGASGKSKSAKDIKAQAAKTDIARGIQGALLWAANKDSADNQVVMDQGNADLLIVEYARTNLPKELAAFVALVKGHQADAADAALKTALEAAADTEAA